MIKRGLSVLMVYLIVSAAKWYLLYLVAAKVAGGLWLYLWFDIGFSIVLMIIIVILTIKLYINDKKEENHKNTED